MKTYRTRALLLLAGAALLSGCAAPAMVDAHSTQSPSALWREKPQQLHLAQLQLRLSIPTTMLMQKQTPTGAAIITEADKRETLAVARAQAQMLDQGFRTQFEKKASQYGVTFSKMSADIVHVAVVSVEGFCEEGLGCRTRLNLEAKVTDIGDKVVWRYEGAVEQSMPREPITGLMFDTFSNRLLDAMQVSGVVAKRPL